MRSGTIELHSYADVGEFVEMLSKLRAVSEATVSGNNGHKAVHVRLAETAGPQYDLGAAIPWQVRSMVKMVEPGLRDVYRERYAIPRQRTFDDLYRKVPE